MCDGSSIVKERQKAIRREMDRRGILLKVVAQDSGISPSTLATYFPQDPNAEPAQIPGGAIYSLTASKALPLDLLSLLQPSGFLVVRVPECIDHDEIGAWAERYAARKMEAHRMDSPMGPEIAPCEDNDLKGIVVAFPGSVAA